MAENGWQRVVTVLTVSCFLLTSCTALKTVYIPSGESPPSLPGSVKVGDNVVVTTKDREKKRFEVTAVEADALVGKDVRVAYADMDTLQVRHIDKGPTIALAVVVGAILLGMLLGEQLADDFVE